MNKIEMLAADLSRWGKVAVRRVLRGTKKWGGQVRYWTGGPKSKG